jgi:hypothetical protein
VWQALYEELHAAGLTVVTVALDIDPEKARPWIDAVTPSDDASSHISLVDSSHSINELLGINNVPMAVWIDEEGQLVRPAENARIEQSAYAKIEITADLPERMQVALTELKKMPDTGDEYRAAIVDWAHNGAASQFALPADEVIARSQPRSRHHAEAAACFELGQHLYRTTGNKEAAVPWWKKAHALDRSNWTYKRQAWTLESTAEGEASDLAQDVGDTYGTSWLDDVLATGGADNYLTVPQL